MKKAAKETAVEVKEKSPRRRLTDSYKLKILMEYDSSTKQGEKGEILRREGLYTSTLTVWRRKLLQGEQGKQVQHSLQVENSRLRRDLEIAQKVIEVQKKILEISETSMKRI